MVGVPSASSGYIAPSAVRGSQRMIYVVLFFHVLLAIVAFG
jgi:hypothetical protein